MATPLLIPALATGEVSPSLYGRVDIDRERIACSTARNAFVNFRGGVSSRAGTKLVGFSKQTTRDFPPRLIPFQFSIKQGLVLEFGNHYMRVISEGEYVTETPVGIGNISNTDPAVMTYGVQGAVTATPNNAGVTFTYAPGDLVTVAGGISLSPAVLEVLSSELMSVVVADQGSGYGVGDTITLAGGTSAPNAVVTVGSIAAVPATGSIVFAVNPADGDTITLNGTVWTFKTSITAGNQTMIQASLPTTLAQLVIDLTASADTEVVKCKYTSDSTTLYITFLTPGVGGNSYTLAATAATPSGGTLTGGVTDGLSTVTVSTPGIFTAVPADGLMTQSGSSGGGTGASFQTAVFAPHALGISNPGAYTALPTNPVSQSSTTGVGLGATFTMTWAAVAPFSNDDWVFIEGVNGMTEVNGNIYRLSGTTSTHANLLDAYGDPIDATVYGIYSGGGTASRIYTLTTPYAEEDLKWMKVTQSADVMTICCVNQDTGSQYIPRDLARFSDSNWEFSNVIPAETIGAPSSISVVINDPDGGTYYAYVVTAISPDDGSESIASPIGRAIGVSMRDHVNAQANISWTVVADVRIYNIYKAEISDLTPVPGGALYGFIGSAYGNQFIDKNYTPDFGHTPPRHQNPFALGRVLSVNMTSIGSGYNQSTATATITSGAGTGAVLAPIVQNGALVAIIVLDAGSGYLQGDPVVITGGTGAAAQATIGPQDGVYPGVPGYFQQRRVFANTILQPDTYRMSQPGAYRNFDTRLPTIDSDAITGTPWSVQVNGIQALVQTPAGLLVMTGQAAWLLVGQGSYATNVNAISPSSQVATPLPFTGCSATIPPQKILFNVLYATPKGDVVYEMPYQGYSFSEPIDLTEYASHMFTGFSVIEWAWSSQPYKLDWTIRDDGIALCMTYLKAEAINGWTRHDTQGSFKSVCTITEPPVDAPYFAIERFSGNRRAYLIERMDNRIWRSVEDSWCVDCALALSQPTPAGTLSANSAYGIGQVTGATIIDGGSGYSSSTTAVIIDQETDEDGNPIGQGATALVAVTGDAISGISITAGGAGYRRPKISFVDTEQPGGGVTRAARAHLALDNTAVFTSTSASFSFGDVGKIIRMGGGVAEITLYTSPGQVSANLNTPISAIAPDTEDEVVPQVTGSWTMTRPVASVGGLLHLAGQTVTGIADGVVITPREVLPSGVVELDAPASSVVIGLGFRVQVQTVPIDAGTPTIQGQRKKISMVSAFVQDSRSVRLGANQQDGSRLSPPRIAPTWKRMAAAPDLLPPPYNSVTAPLYTGWVRTPVSGGWDKFGQIAIEVTEAVPLTVLAFAPEILVGDTPSQGVKLGKEAESQ